MKCRLEGWGEGKPVFVLQPNHIIRPSVHSPQRAPACVFCCIQWTSDSRLCTWGYCLTLSLFRWLMVFRPLFQTQCPTISNPSPVPDNLPSVRLPSSSGSALTRTSMPRRLFNSRDSITDSAAMVNRFLVDAYVHVHHRESGMVSAVQRQSTMKNEYLGGEGWICMGSSLR